MLGIWLGFALNLTVPAGGGQLMAIGYVIYRSSVDWKWCLVELPDDWKREEALPPRATDAWFSTKKLAEAEFTRRLAALTP